MEMFSNIEINLIGLAIIAIVVCDMPHKINKALTDHKIFLGLVSFTTIIILLDIVQLCLDGVPGFISRDIQYSAMIVSYCLNPIICLLYALYSDFQIYHDSLKAKKLAALLMPPAILIAILSVLSPVYHFLFYIDSNNNYHRGEYVLSVAIIDICYIIGTVVKIIIKKKKLKKNDSHALLLFALPPTAGGIIQTLFYGTTILWVCVAISILIVYIKIQNSNIFTDYLTGLNNRRQLDIYLSETVNKHVKNISLAGMMIDINDFKKINDLYGHESGDRALKNTGKILKKSFGREDFIARYGGDEFIIIFKIKEKKDMRNAEKRIRKHTEEFNKMKKAPYYLSFSAGYDIFDYQSENSTQQFLKRIDRLMYEDKKKQKKQKDNCINA